MFLLCMQPIKSFIVLKERFWAEGELCHFGNIFFILGAGISIHLVRLHFVAREAAWIPMA